MSWEALWYSSYRGGRRPALRRLPRRVTQEPTAALRLAYAIHVGASGYRSVSDSRWPGDPIYFWDRAGGQWWSVPVGFERCVRDHIRAAEEAVRRGGHALATRSDGVESLLAQWLQDAGEPVSTLDGRLTPVLYGAHDAPDVPRALRRRIAALIAERNTCSDDVVPALDCRLIELARPYAPERERDQ